MSFETQPFPGEPVNTGVHRGVHWCSMQGPFSLNGYVRLPENHPWLGKGEFLDDLDSDEYPTVHGGITYGPNKDRWIGFDTAHSDDLIDFEPDFSTMVLPPIGLFRQWSDTEVEEECVRLCEQVADAMRRD